MGSQAIYLTSQHKEMKFYGQKFLYRKDLEDMINMNQRNTNPLKLKGRDWAGKHTKSIKNLNPCEAVIGPKSILTQCLTGIHWNFPNWMQWSKAQKLITCPATKLNYSIGTKLSQTSANSRAEWNNEYFHPAKSSYFISEHQLQHFLMDAKFNVLSKIE